MKNINRIKVVLSLILGLGGVVHGSLHEDDDFSLMDVEENLDPLYKNVGVSTVSVSPEARRYLIGDAGYTWFGLFESKRFVFMNGRGEFIFFPDEDLSDFLSRVKCFVLPRCLFDKIANKEVCSSMKVTYGEIEDEIHEHIDEEKDRLCAKVNEGYPLVLRMTKEGRGGQSFTVADGGNGEIHPSIPGGMNVRGAYCVEIPEMLYEKITHRTFRERVGAVKQAVLGSCGRLLVGLLGYFVIAYYFGF
jgi:hypothetical protein